MTEMSRFPTYEAVSLGTASRTVLGTVLHTGFWLFIPSLLVGSLTSPLLVRSLTALDGVWVVPVVMIVVPPIWVKVLTVRVALLMSLIEASVSVEISRPISKPCIVILIILVITWVSFYTLGCVENWFLFDSNIRRTLVGKINKTKVDKTKVNFICSTTNK
jgi:hypothetical protein